MVIRRVWSSHVRRHLWSWRHGYTCVGLQHFLVESLNVRHHLGFGGLDTLPYLVDVLEELRELRQHVEERLDNDNSELLSSSIASESFDHKLEGDVLEHSVEEIVFDDCAEELGDLGQILLRVSVQESVLVKESV